ncbi:unnamed protein product [Dimorphilus gyrociliatus]|uniref:C2H2-type domain-containing protein n=1 Tax=Dimorphilus gyrociliatus TaxID=2664684 RepID=A0A7I8VTK8_9ANNE|nr:unnamed protein product [Dimorphilus gyrociliatus]
MAFSASISDNLALEIKNRLINAILTFSSRFDLIQGLIVYRIGQGLKPNSILLSQRCAPSNETLDNADIVFDEVSRLEVHLGIIKPIKEYTKKYLPEERCVFINATVYINLKENLGYVITINNCFSLFEEGVLESHDLRSPICSFSKELCQDLEAANNACCDSLDFKETVRLYKRRVADACREDLRMTLRPDGESLDIKKHRKDTFEELPGTKRLKTDWTCLSCNTIFDEPESYEQHVHEHINRLNRHVPSMFLTCEADAHGNAIIKCGICKELTDKGKHVLKVHGTLLGDRLVDNTKKGVQKDKSRLDCPLCRNAYPQYYDLLRHIRSSHLQYDKFRCPECKRQYVSGVGIHKHLITEHYQYYVDFYHAKKEDFFPDVQNLSLSAV